MNTKITRLDSRRDTEAINWADELRETEAWFESPRFQEITRLHTAFEVVALRGNAREDHTVARPHARRLFVDPSAAQHGDVRNGGSSPDRATSTRAAAGRVASSAYARRPAACSDGSGARPVARTLPGT